MMIVKRSLMVLLVLASGLLLASCDDKPDVKPEQNLMKLQLPAFFESSDTWIHFFADKYPALVSCMEKAPSQPALVLGVEPLDQRLAQVVVKDKSGAIYNCLGNIDGKGVEKFEKRTTKLEVQPIYIPVQVGTPKPDSCLFNLPVKDDKGQVLGWVSVPRCKF